MRAQVQDHQRVQQLCCQLNKQKICQKLADVKIKIICLLYESQQCISDSLNHLLKNLPDINFNHIFNFCYQDEQFIQRHQKSIIKLLINNFSYCHQGVSCLNDKKKITLFESLFHGYVISEQKKSMIIKEKFIQNIIDDQCKSNFDFAYTLLWNINEIFLQNYYGSYERISEKINLNEITQFCCRIVNNFAILPSFLLNQAFRFISRIFLPVSLFQANSSQLKKNSLKQVIKLILEKVQQIQKAQGFNKLGYVYYFLAFVIEKQLIEDVRLKELIQMCCGQIEKSFPEASKQSDQINLNILQKQIEKIQHHYHMNNIQQYKNNIAQKIQQQLKQDQLDDGLLLKNHIEKTIRLSILRGVSLFISQVFKDSIKNENIIGENLIKYFKKFLKTFKILIRCNDHEMFCNFTQIYVLKQSLNKRLILDFNFTPDLFLTQLVNNCPSTSTISHKSIIKQIESIIAILNPDQISLLLQMIKCSVEQNYDHSFNIHSFKSACNLLVIIIKLLLSKQQYHLIINKNMIIEWIKMLLNLNQSCLIQYRQIIIKKTYQIISVSFDAILPRNQYLQEVIQNQLIDSYPDKKQILHNLIQFYQQNSITIFSQGYSNKFVIKKYLQIQSLVDPNQNNKIQEQINSTNSIGLKEKINIKVRKLKLLSRLFEKLSNNNLSFNEKIQLWILVYRVYMMNSRNDEENLDISKLKKMHDDKLDQIIAKHFAATQLQLSQEIKNIVKLDHDELLRLKKQIQKWSIFFADQLARIISSQ